MEHIYLVSESILHEAKDKKKKKKVSSLIIIYSWTFKLLMRTNEAVFQSVSMQ